MNIEYECRLLEINKENFEKLLLEKGAVKKGDYFQKRYTYDFNPKREINGLDFELMEKLIL